MAAVLCVEEWLLVLDFLPLPDLVRFALGGHWGHALASTPATPLQCVTVTPPPQGASDRSGVGKTVFGPTQGGRYPETPPPNQAPPKSRSNFSLALCRFFSGFGGVVNSRP